MAIQLVNTGTSANAGDGDSLRSAFNKVNNNFNEIYNLVGSVDTIEDRIGNLLTSATTTGLIITYNTLTNDTTFTVTNATTQTVGGIIVGDNLTISNGILSGLTPYTLPVAAVSVLGGIRSSDTVLIDQDARAFVPTASTSSFGVVSISTGLSSVQGVLSLDLSAVDQNILPAADLTYDLGSTSSQWRSLYVGTSTIYLGGTALTVGPGGDLLVGGTSVIGVNPFNQNLDTTDYVVFAQITATNSLRINSTEIALGQDAGVTGPQGAGAVAIGAGAGQISQGPGSIAIGNVAGNTNQGIGSLSIGSAAGGDNQGDGAIAIGNTAGVSNQGNYAIAIGAGAGATNQPANSIVINANNAVDLDADVSGLFINPIRSDTTNTGKVVYYNTSTKELTYADSSYTRSVTTFEIDETTTSTSGLVGADTIIITPAVGYVGSDTQTLEFIGRDVTGMRTLMINASTLCTVDFDFVSMDIGPIIVSPSTVTEVIYVGNNNWYIISERSM